MDLGNLDVPGIIGNARSPLGITALVILAMSFLAFSLFRDTSEKTRVGIFCAMFLGAALLTGTIFSGKNPDNAATATIGPSAITPTVSQNVANGAADGHPDQAPSPTPPPPTPPSPRPPPPSCLVADLDREFNVAPQTGRGSVNLRQEKLIELIATCTAYPLASVKQIVEGYAGVVFVRRHDGSIGPDVGIPETKDMSVAVCNLSVNRGEVDFDLEIPRARGVGPKDCREFGNLRTGNGVGIVSARLANHMQDDAVPEQLGWYAFVFYRS